MEILTASYGFCMGIKRAYAGINNRALAEEAPFAVTHQNSANPFDTLRRIARKDAELLARYPGLDRVSVELDTRKLGPGDRVALGFHGLPDEEKRALAERSVDLIDDHICPFIAKLDRIVERHAQEGYDIAMVGSSDNHHVRTARQLVAAHGRHLHVITSADDVDDLPRDQARRIVLVGQVTGNTHLFHEVIARIEALGLPIKIRRTMCADSHGRQREAVELARQADLVIVLDDGGDAARSVIEACARVNPRLHRVRDKQDVRPEWLGDAAKVAIVCGIMIPEWSVQELAGHVQALHDQTNDPR